MGKIQHIYPKNYVMVDIESTGLLPEFDNILEMAAVRVVDGTESDTLSSLVRYSDRDNRVPGFVSDLTGITTDMIIHDANPIEEFLPQLKDFIGDDLIVGFNVHFDLSFISQALLQLSMEPLDNDWVDVLSMARRFWPDEKHNKMSQLITRIGIEREQEHRSLSDCHDQIDVMNYIMEHSDESIFSKSKPRKRPYNPIDFKAIHAQTDDIDTDNPFYRQNICFTGKLSINRAEAAQVVANLGAVPQKGVTKETDILVVGDFTYVSSVENGVSGKLKKAQEYISKGLDIQIIPESEFVNLLK
jgi:DNA polymerase-3 subunit epsilon